jgi:hypothetical protein
LRRKVNHLVGWSLKISRSIKQSAYSRVLELNAFISPGKQVGQMNILVYQNAINSMLPKADFISKQHLS